MNEMDVLRAAQPDVPVPGRQSWDTALDRLAEAATEAGTERRPKQVHRWARPRRLITVGALGPAIVLGLAVLPGLDGGGTRPASAAVILGQAADLALVDKVPTPKPGQWIYIEARESGVPGAGVDWAPGEDSDTPHPTTVRHVRSWAPSTGAQGGKSAGKCLPAPAPAKGCERATEVPELIMQVNGREEALALFGDFEGWNPDDYTFVQKLPIDRDALLRQIYRFAETRAHIANGHGSREQEAFGMITQLLGGWTSPRLRAALFGALARIPGVTVQQDAVDYTGRHGIGFTRSDDSKKSQIILDRRTYHFLGEKVIATRATYGAVKPGTLLRWSSQLRLAVVDKARQLP